MEVHIVMWTNGYYEDAVEAVFQSEDNARAYILQMEEEDELLEVAEDERSSWYIESMELED